jgi:hypothetical protein
MVGLATKNTCAPLGCVQCWMGIAARADCKPNKAPELASKAVTAMFLILFMIPG